MPRSAAAAEHPLVLPEQDDYRLSRDLPVRIPAGRVDRDSVISGVDWLPTVCALTGADTSGIEADGEDVSDILAGQPRKRHGPLFWEWKFDVWRDERYKPPQLAMREGRWKLFMNPDGNDLELYDLRQDPAELTNRVEDHPDVVQHMKPRVTT